MLMVVASSQERSNSSERVLVLLLSHRCEVLGSEFIGELIQLLYIKLLSFIPAGTQIARAHSWDPSMVVCSSGSGGLPTWNQPHRDAPGRDAQGVMLEPD